MTLYTDQFSNKLGLNSAEASFLLNNLTNESSVSSEDEQLDYIELFLAIALNAKLRGLTHDSRYTKLKLLINNNSKRAVSIGNRWMDGQISFETMLVII